MMMFIGGYYGAFTYSIRGGVFCNAQTGNFVLLAMALGGGNWQKAIYYLIPITAYCFGAFISEMAINTMKSGKVIKWEPLLLIIEIAIVAFLGLLPESAPVQITQILINFICSMQYNTFRQMQGLPMATTFCTNHIRQVGVALSRVALGDGTGQAAGKLAVHLEMLGSFVLGGIFSTALCGRLRGRAIWAAMIPLAVVLTDLLYADLKKE